MKKRQESLFESVKQEAYRAHMVCASWDDLVLALRTYSRGGRSAAYGHTLRSTEGDGGLVMLYADAVAGVTGDSIVEKVLLPKFEAWRSTKNHYYQCSEGFDYDGGRMFHKTSVDVMELDAARGVYALGLSAAYVGQQPENELAATLGLPQALWWTKTLVTGRADDDHYYRLPLDVIVERLSAVRGLPLLNAEALAFRLRDAWQKDVWSLPAVTLVDDGTCAVNLGFETLAFDIPQRAAWDSDGTTVLCPVRASQYPDEIRDYGAYRPPVWFIEVRAGRNAGPRTDRLPLWRPAHIDAALALSQEIADAIGGV